MLETNSDRVLKDLYDLRKIGAFKTGVHRPTLSPEDMEARHWLVDRLKAIGHEACIDGVANVFGRSPGEGPHVLAGSHIESQNHAGWLDGALGVVYALEAARAAAEDKTIAGGVDVMAFADEEGHFSGSFLGSKSFVGALSEEAMDAAFDRSGRGSLRHCLKEAGLADRPRVQWEPGRYKAFFEAHIEQGDRLESEGLSIGVVTSIVAIWQYRILFAGEQNHAGTTTMKSRKDAGKALLNLWRRIEQVFPDIAGPFSVWTTGSIALEPGAPSIIPGRAEMIFQFRDAEQAVLDRMHAHLLELVAEVDAEGPCRVEIEILGQLTPALMAPGPKEALIEAVATWAPDDYKIMPSGAAHDAQVIAAHIPSAMMFVPSIGGISHHWSENTSDEHIKLGAKVFVEATDRMLRSA